MTNEEKMKIFEDQVLKVGEALTKFFDEAGEKLKPVFEALVKAAAVCEANNIVLTENGTCGQCKHFEECVDAGADVNEMSKKCRGFSKKEDPQKTCEECAYFERTENGELLCVEEPSFTYKMPDTVPCNHFVPAQDASEAAETHDFREGELIVYVNGETFQIGEIKRLCDDGAFVYYHEGDTASKTPFENMHKLQNAYCIKQTSLAQGRPRCGNCEYFCMCANSAGNTRANVFDDASECDKYTEDKKRCEACLHYNDCFERALTHLKEKALICNEYTEE